MKTRWNCDTTHCIVCPYCYNDCEDDRYEVVNNSNGQYISFTCEHCDKEFRVFADIIVTYTSARLDENDNIIEEWIDLEDGDCKYGCCDCIWEDTDMCDSCVDRDKYDDECK